MCPERQAVLCRELTKLHEETLRGTLSELAALDREWLGEVTLVLGAEEREARDVAEDPGVTDEEIARRLAKGAHPRDLSAELAGRLRPSRELPLHLAIYRERPDAGAVIHTHSPYATAWSFRGLRLPDSEDLEYMGVGPVITSEPAPAGSETLAQSVMAGLGESKATLIGEHGVVALGADPWEAFAVAQVVEAAARVAWILSGRVAEPAATLPRP